MEVVSTFTPWPVRERFSKVVHTEVKMPPETERKLVWVWKEDGIGKYGVRKERKGGEHAFPWSGFLGVNCCYEVDRV